MKSRHLVCLLSLVTFATLFVLVSAQSRPADAKGAALLLTPSGDAPAQPGSSGQLVRFLPPVSYGAGGAGANIVAIGDLNGDGIPDLVASVTDDGVTVLLGNGDGTFQDPVSYYPGATFPFTVAIADVNNDGKPDVVVGDSYGIVGVLLGNGDGTFQPVVVYDTGANFTKSVAVADVNGDGNPDIIVASACVSGVNCQAGVAGVVSVLSGNGDGTFQPAVTFSSGAYNASFVAVADVNGDGKPDLIVPNQCTVSSDCGNDSPGEVSVFLNNGDGTFQTPATYSSGGNFASAVAVADLNGDGNPDLVVSNYGSGTVSVLLGNGNGTFQNAVTYASGGVNPAPGPLVIADVNGDGKLDLVVANSCQGKRSCFEPGPVGVLLGNGDGTFQTPVTYKSGGRGPNSVAVGDLNGDGRSDIVAANGCLTKSCDGFSVGVLLNDLRVSAALSLSSSLNPSPVNQTVTFTAAITSSLPVPNGKVVTFYSGATELGTAITKNGTATLATSFYTAKTYTIKATFPEGGYFKAGSATMKQVVNNDPVLNPASGPIVGSSAIAPLSPRELSKASHPNFQETLCPSKTKAFPDGGGPYVTETFMLGATANMNEHCHNVFHYICLGQMDFYLFSNGAWNLLGPGTWVEECAWEYHTSTLTAGNHRFKAVYNADPNGYGPSSGLSSEYVEKWPTTTTLTSTPNPSSNGQDVTFTASAVPDPDSGLIPTGKMRFFNGTKSLGAVMVDSNGNATLITKRLPSGQDSITAEYLGDADNAGSTSSPYIQVVNQAVVENAEEGNQ
jgi:hypothetical protein